ncbi:hypothetical protein PO124_20150 [Bacillus licheniformis]|nr:hypothetical protein [Bacillus licheniformis]
MGSALGKGVLQKGRRPSSLRKTPRICKHGRLHIGLTARLNGRAMPQYSQKKADADLHCKRKARRAETVVRVSEQKDEITVNTGAIVCKLGKSGPALIRSISISGEMMAKEGRLIALKEKEAVQIHKACIILNGLRAWSNVRQSNKRSGQDSHQD